MGLLYVVNLVSVFKLKRLEVTCVFFNNREVCKQQGGQVSDLKALLSYFINHPISIRSNGRQIQLVIIPGKNMGDAIIVCQTTEI